MREGRAREDAELEATRQLGNVVAAREEYRDTRGIRWLDECLQDTRYAMRTMARTPGFTAIAVLTLALGIGANTAIFSLIHAALLRTAPYPDADRLVEICRVHRGEMGYPVHTSRKYLYFREHTRSFSEIAATRNLGNVNLIAGGEAQQVKVTRASANYFRTLGVEPGIGRGFTTEEERYGGPDVAVISHALWQHRFGGDPLLVGRTINLGGQVHTVVGIMPKDFVAIPHKDVWLPNRTRSMNDGTNTRVIGRLKDGVTWQTADDDVRRVMDAFRREYPKDDFSRDESAGIAPFNSAEGRSIRPQLTILFGVVAAVLLIACANVANLLMSRAAGRTREIAIRAAIGAGRSRIVRQLMTESMLLALLGGVLGLAIAFGGVPVLVKMNPVQLDAWREIQINPAALAFTGSLAVMTAFLFGVIPALSATRLDLHAATREGSVQATSGRVRQRMRRALVVAEVALSMALLIGSGLLIRTFVNLMQTDTGVDSTNVVAGQMSLGGAKYDTTDKVSQLFNKGLERIRAISSVESAAVVLNLPIERGMNIVAYVPASKDPAKPNLTDWRYATPDYFATLRIPVLAGRVFTEADGPNAAPVAVINRRFAEMYFGAVNPVGLPVKLSPSSAPWTVVGIVGDTKQGTLTQRGPAILFVPAAQAQDEFMRAAHSWFAAQWVIRTRDSGQGIIAAVQRELRGIDPLTPISEFRTLDDVRSAAVRPWRFMMVLVSVFAGLALLLAAAGIYGVISYQVESRRHEMGILLALGATAGNLIRSVLWRGVSAAVFGVVLGAMLSVWMANIITTLLFGVKATDAVTFVAAAAFLIAIAALASLFPAMRVTRLNPAHALRVE